MTLTVGSLFTGIGGLDLGLERAGMTVVWQSEIDPYCCRVLAKHWPHVPNLGDVTTIDWSDVERVDLICGGYPCQPFSLAGIRRGESDPRHLWPYLRDAIRALRPRWALLENVSGHLSLGFGRVLGDLAEIGYDAEWDCVPAAAVGAPHLRWRVFIVAYPHGQQHEGRSSSERRPAATQLLADASRVGGADEPEGDRPWIPVGAVAGPSGRTERRDSAEGALVDRRGTGVMAAAVADTSGPGLEGPRGLHHPRAFRGTVPTDGGWWATEPDVGRVAHGIPHRVDRLRALGNAVVPQVAEHIGRLIVEATW